MSSISFQDLQPCISHLQVGGTHRLRLFIGRMPETHLKFPLADLLADCFQKLEAARQNNWDEEQKKLAGVEERNIRHLTPLILKYLSNVLKDKTTDLGSINIRAILASVQLLSKVQLEQVDQKALTVEWIQKARESVQKLPAPPTVPVELWNKLVLAQGNNRHTKAIVAQVIKLLPL